MGLTFTPTIYLSSLEARVNTGGWVGSRVKFVTDGGREVHTRRPESDIERNGVGAVEGQNELPDGKPNAPNQVYR